MNFLKYREINLILKQKLQDKIHVIVSYPDKKNDWQIPYNQITQRH